MMLHRATINRRKGFTLAMVTSLMWAILPITLKSVLQRLDPITMTWYRFILAAVFFGIGQAFTRQSSFRVPAGRHLLLWLAAILGLIANHTIYVLGLSYLQPVAATVFIQLAPVFLLAGGLIVFREPFSRIQWLGLGVLLLGMALFFYPELSQIRSMTRQFMTGAALIILAALCWTLYALAQKQLLVSYTSRQIVAVIYISGAVLLYWGARPAAIMSLDGPRIGLVLFAGFNTVVAYGCFSEALDHWDASRVSAVLAVIPVMTLLLMLVAQQRFPGYVEPENLTWGKFAGAVIVVVGSMVCALARRRDQKSQ
ncbi:DMT family transporter [bacterium]|nr:DMT family transporter [candidate division CSSED10-310 bacterium]